MKNCIDMQMVEELLELSDDGDHGLIIDLIEMFLEDAPVKVAAIHAGLEKQDLDVVERSAHSLKGSSGTLGAFLVQEDCETLQLASRDGQLETCQTASAQLDSHLAEAVSALSEFLAKLR